jgi:hypothetical protein
VHHNWKAVDNLATGGERTAESVTPLTSVKPEEAATKRKVEGTQE